MNIDLGVLFPNHPCTGIYHASISLAILADEDLITVQLRVNDGHERQVDRHHFEYRPADLQKEG